MADSTFIEQGASFTYEIPDGLQVDDIIEIVGQCRGDQIQIRLIDESGAKNTLPFDMRLMTGGPWDVRAIDNLGEEFQKDGFAMHGLQHDLGFHISVAARLDHFEVSMNGHQIVVMDYVVPLIDITHLYMDGDAEFTRVEFKDGATSDDISLQNEAIGLTAAITNLPVNGQAPMVRVEEKRMSQRKPQLDVDVNAQTSASAKFGFGKPTKGNKSKGGSADAELAMNSGPLVMPKSQLSGLAPIIASNMHQMQASPRPRPASLLSQTQTNEAPFVASMNLAPEVDGEATIGKNSKSGKKDIKGKKSIKTTRPELDVSVNGEEPVKSVNVKKGFSFGGPKLPKIKSKTPSTGMAVELDEPVVVVAPEAAIAVHAAPPGHKKKKSSSGMPDMTEPQASLPRVDYIGPEIDIDGNMEVPRFRKPPGSKEKMTSPEFAALMKADAPSFDGLALKSMQEMPEPHFHSGASLGLVPAVSTGTTKQGTKTGKTNKKRKSLDMQEIPVNPARPDFDVDVGLAGGSSSKGGPKLPKLGMGDFKFGRDPKNALSGRVIDPTLHLTELETNKELVVNGGVGESIHKIGKTPTMEMPTMEMPTREMPTREMPTMKMPKLGNGKTPSGSLDGGLNLDTDTIRPQLDFDMDERRRLDLPNRLRIGTGHRVALPSSKEKLHASEFAARLHSSVDSLGLDHVSASNTGVDMTRPDFDPNFYTTRDIGLVEETPAVDVKRKPTQKDKKKSFRYVASDETIPEMVVSVPEPAVAVHSRAPDVARPDLDMDTSRPKAEMSGPNLDWHWRMPKFGLGHMRQPKSNMRLENVKVKDTSKAQMAAQMHAMEPSYEPHEMQLASVNGRASPQAHSVNATMDIMRPRMDVDDQYEGLVPGLTGPYQQSRKPPRKSLFSKSDKGDSDFKRPRSKSRTGSVSKLPKTTAPILAEYLLDDSGAMRPRPGTVSLTGSKPEDICNFYDFSFEPKTSHTKINGQQSSHDKKKSVKAPKASANGQLPGKKDKVERSQSYYDVRGNSFEMDDQEMAENDYSDLFFKTRASIPTASRDPLKIGTFVDEPVLVPVFEVEKPTPAIKVATQAPFYPDMDKDLKYTPNGFHAQAPKYTAKPKRKVQRAISFNSLYDIRRSLIGDEPSLNSSLTDSTVDCTNEREIDLRSLGHHSGRTPSITVSKKTPGNYDDDDTISTISSACSNDLEMIIQNFQVESKAWGHSRRPSKHNPINTDFIAPMTVNWQQGRRVVLTGHFEKSASALRPTEILLEGRNGYNMLTEHQKGMLKEPSSKDHGEHVVIKIWSSGDALIEGNTGQPAFNWASRKKDQQAKRAQLRFEVREKYLGVTINDEVTCIRRNIDCSLFRVVRIPSETESGFVCESLTFPSELTTPLRVAMPEFTGKDNRHLGLKLLRTAKNRNVCIKLTGTKNSQIKANVDLVKRQASLQVNKMATQTVTFEMPSEGLTLIDLVLHEVQSSKKLFGSVSLLLDGEVIQQTTLPGTLPMQDLNSYHVNADAAICECRMQHHCELLMN